MTKPKLVYFDAAVSRGEECRLALYLAGVDFDDVRVSHAEWADLKPKTAYGSLPILEMPGFPPLAQTNAILVFIGRQYGLHPKDAFHAAHHEAMMSHVEDLRSHVGPTLRISDEAEKKKARANLSESYLPSWASNAERQIDETGPFFGGAALQVVDLKLHRAVHWITSGIIDDIPTTVFSDFPRLNRIFAEVRDHGKIKAWYSR